MLNVLINITITQQTEYQPETGPPIQRNLVFTIPSCHSFEVYSSWKNLSDIATVIFPKNMYAYTQNGNIFSFGTIYGTDNLTIMPSNKFTSGFPAPANQIPLFMRGDKITIT